MQYNNNFFYELGRDGDEKNLKIYWDLLCIGMVTQIQPIEDDATVTQKHK